jgi:hypothetical protein
MDLKWLIWHLEFSSELDSYCLDVQIPALEPKVDILDISFGYPEAVTRQPRSEGLYLYNIVSLYCGVVSPSVGLAVHLSFNL